MIVNLLGEEVDIGKVEVGNELDIQIRDKIAELDPFYKKAKKNAPGADKKIAAIIADVKSLVQFKNGKYT